MKTRLLAVLAVLAAGVAVPALSAPAHADIDASPDRPTTVTAKSLPTVQVNGIVWSQVTVGNIVYATGQFSTARPAGVPVGGAGEVAVGNLIAYDIRTGERLTTFNHTLNGAGQVVHANAAGTRLYVGGDFTTVDGQPRGHIAAFDLTDNSLVPTFAPDLDGTVKAIATTGNKVFAGGSFTHAGANFRSRLVAIVASNGGIYPWAPTAGQEVSAMVMSPDQTKLIVGGQFEKLSGTSVYGLGALDPDTAAVLPFAANNTVRDYNKGGITSLTTDGTDIYGTGFAYGAGGTFEGSFSAKPSDGSLNWVADCLGDTYSGYTAGDVYYSVSHAHNCSAIGSFPDTSPRVRWQRALAMTSKGTHPITTKDAYGWNYVGQQAPDVLQWFPNLANGNVSGQSQAAWSVTGNGTYVALGGEFPSVNTDSQQGLARFAPLAQTGTSQQPTLVTNPSVVIDTTATAVRGDAVRLTYGGAWDRDNEALTYKVYRNGVLVDTSVKKTNFWSNLKTTYLDTGLAAGTYTYKVLISDSTGKVATVPESPAVTVTGGPGTPSAYAAAVTADSPALYWRQDEIAGPTAYDSSGNNVTGAIGTGVGLASDGATGDGDLATSAGTGSASTIIGSEGVVAATPAFSLETWFKTTTTTGGKLIGYGNKNNGASTSYDRMVYMGNDGKLRFGLVASGNKVVASPKAYNDGSWHHVVATEGADGMQLYVDGIRVARDATATTPSSTLTSGYWTVGGDTMGTWSGYPTNRYFSGSLDDSAVYKTALDRDRVRAHYTASGRTVSTVSTPTDTYGAAVVGDAPSLYWRLGESTTSGGAVDASGNDEAGSYFGSTTLNQAGAITGGDSAIKTSTTTDSGVTANSNSAAPQTYSVEAWFQTSSTKGGKLVGFADRLSGTSANTDRSLMLLNTGRLRFVTGANGANYLDTTTAVNDNKWHQVVATQGPEGMKLYLDGTQVAENTVSASQTFAGFWRVGGDKIWTGSTNRYWSGSIDDVSVYPSVLRASQVSNHFAKSGRTPPAVAPTASFTSGVTMRTAAFDASASDGGSGQITGYAWDFGDNTTGTGATAQHSYAQPGTYTVRVTVTADTGLTATTTRQVVVTNTAPTAAFTSSSRFLKATLSGQTSSDPDGTLATYAWDFGDGTTGTGVDVDHTYAAGGTYPVTLTVTDNDGATATKTADVTVSANQAPTAAFTSTNPADLKVALDAGGSSDADGTVASYAWEFGDGTTGSGATATHTYAAVGTYQVTLTVTDNEGATGSVTKAVQATGPVAADAFDRTVSRGWGSAGIGGAWTQYGGAAAFNVANGAGTLTTSTAGSGLATQLNGVNTTDNDVRVRFSVDKLANGGGQYVFLNGRGTNNDGYRAKLQITSTGAAVLSVVKTIGGADTQLAGGTIAGLTIQPGTWYTLRVQVAGNGTTAVKAKLWTGASEPDWQRSATDQTASLQGPGAVGVRTYLSGTATTLPVTVSFDDFDARAPIN